MAKPKKKGGRVTPKGGTFCPKRKGKLPHKVISRKRIRPLLNDTTVIAEMVHGDPGPWVAKCMFCGTVVS